MHSKNPSRRSALLPLLSLAACLLLGTVPVVAQNAQDNQTDCVGKTGSLLITPKRVVFSGRDRSAEVQLMNNGCKLTTYRVELIEMRMTEAGRLLTLDDPAPASLGRMVRFAPRQVTIAAGERQTVRMFLRKPADLELGEYRSHLHLRAIPDATESIGAAAPAVEENGFSLRLVALPGLSIPIIVRHGQLAAAIGLSDLAVETGAGPPRVSLRLDRMGERSVYGDLAAEFLPAAGGASPVGKAKGIAVYTSVLSRTFAMPLHPPDGVSLAEGRLRVTFRSRPDADGGGDPITASGEIALP